MVSETVFSWALDDQIDTLVNSSQWRDIDGLSSNSTTGTNSGGIFSGTTLDDGLEENLEWVAAGEESDDFKGLLEDSDSHLLFTILSIGTHHKGVNESFTDWALDLLESLLLIFTSSVWNVNLSFSI